MKRWILLISLVVLLAALAVTVRVWLSPLLAFVGANTDLIQGLQAGAQIVLWLGVGAVAIFGYLRGRQKPAPLQDREVPPAVTAEPDTMPMPQVRQQTTGPGVQVGRDQTVQGDLVMGDRIGRQINTGGGPYIEGDVQFEHDDHNAGRA
jgi:hypothetical protein